MGRWVEGAGGIGGLGGVEGLGGIEGVDGVGGIEGVGGVGGSRDRRGRMVEGCGAGGRRTSVGTRGR